MPGVPDVYQDTELWDLSLVDPGDVGGPLRGVGGPLASTADSSAASVDRRL